MRSYWFFSVLASAFIGCTVFLFTITSHPESFYYAFGLTANILFFSMLTKGKNFLILIAEVLLTGFYLIVVANGNAAYLDVQLHLVMEHVLFFICSLLLWLFFTSMQSLSAQYQVMESTAKALQKYEDQLLTLPEFMDRAKLLLTGMDRRKEKGYVITLSIHPPEESLRSSLFHYFSASVLTAVRKEYDLIAKTSDQGMLLLLQNTNEEGCQIVLARIREKIEENLFIDDQLYSIHIEECTAPVLERFLQKGSVA